MCKFPIQVEITEEVSYRRTLLSEIPDALIAEVEKQSGAFTAELLLQATIQEE